MAQVDANPFLAPAEESQSAQQFQPSPWRRVIFWGAAIFLIVLLLAMLAPLSRGVGVRQAALRSTCQNNLRQIAIAMHNYESLHGCFPPAYTVDENGSPLHSWRVLILPFMEQQELYDSLDLTKPWNDPVNEHARKKTLYFYSCPSNPCPKGYTSYLANAWEKGAFVPGEGKKFKEFTDGMSNTIALFEVKSDRAVEWMSPQDGDYQTFIDNFDLPVQPHTTGVNVAMADASAHFFRERPPSSDGSYLPFFTIAEGDKAER